jgi:hypothetical protein
MTRRAGAPGGGVPAQAGTTALLTLALLFAGGIPTRQPGAATVDAERGPPRRDEATV